MNDFITLKKSDPDFHRYLLGDIGPGKLALPVESLNIHSQNEQVTYKIVNKDQISSPHFLRRWSETLKLQNTLLVLFPIFLVLMKNWVDQTIQFPLEAGLAALGAVLLHIAGNLRNDFLDHVEGLDRVHPMSGSRAIQNGWIKAFQVKQLSSLCAVFGVLFGIPAMILVPSLWWIVAAAVILGSVGLYSFNSGLKFRRFTEFAVFFLLGPLLTMGFQLSLGTQLDVEVVALGILSGWLAVFYLHIKNFGQLMINSKAHLKSSIVLFGFEKGKVFLAAWWLAFLVMLNAYHALFAPTYWAWVIFGVSLLVSAPYFFALNSLTSPLGSQLQRAQDLARRMLNFIIAIWLVENLWFVWSISL